jgi:hypothetical protein
MIALRLYLCFLLAVAAVFDGGMPRAHAGGAGNNQGKAAKPAKPSNINNDNNDNNRDESDSDGGGDDGGDGDDDGDNGAGPMDANEPEDDLCIFVALKKTADPCKRKGRDDLFGLCPAHYRERFVTPLKHPTTRTQRNRNQKRLERSNERAHRQAQNAMLEEQARLLAKYGATADALNGEESISSDSGSDEPMSNRLGAMLKVRLP